MIIKQDEIDDFRESVVRNKFDENDFEIKDEDISKPNPDGINDEKIKIIVMRKSNGKQKTYFSGHVTKWNAEFDDDLKSDFFGSP